MTKQHELAKKVFNSSLNKIFGKILTEDLAESFKKSNIIVSRDAETGEAQKVSLIGSRTLIIEKKSQTVFHVRFDTEDHSMFGIRSLSKDSTDVLMVFENKINQFHLVQGFFDSIVQEYSDFCEQELLNSAATDFLTSKTSPADLYIDTEEELLKKEIPESFEYVTVDVDLIKRVREGGSGEMVVKFEKPDFRISTLAEILKDSAQKTQLIKNFKLIASKGDISEDIIKELLNEPLVSDWTILLDELVEKKNNQSLIDNTGICFTSESLGSEFIKDLTTTLTPDPVEENSGTEIDKEETETQTVKRGKKSKK